VSSDTVMHRSIALACEPTSPGAARRFLRDLLREVDRPGWAEAAELAVSEVVTNAVLHAHSDVELTAQVELHRLNVQVRDHSPTLPSQRGYDSHATTGRGLDLVAAVTAEHGVQSLGGEGKVVWFSVTDDGADEPSGEDLLDQWDTGAFAVVDLAVEDPGAATVVLRSMPPTLWLAAREHHDAVLRELALHRAGEHRFVDDLAAADRARFAISSALSSEVDRARQQGRLSRPLPQYHPGSLPEVPDAFDLVLTVTAAQSADFSALQDVLDEGEHLAASGRLLVHPGLPEIVAVRDWACEQVVAQLAGSPPAPWPGADDERFLRDVQPVDLAGDHGWNDVVVRQAAGGAVAVDDANRIVSISEPLAAEIGWRPQDLVGRRVVVIIPPRFREAHVAGFSRHLSTGEARTIGTDLVLPMLRADGSEVSCSFLIETHPTPRGRQVYIAWIAPLREPA
jgi:PAS domain S-box-containing protein